MTQKICITNYQPVSAVKMDFVLLDRLRFEREYNCSFFNVDSVPLSERRHLLLGALCVVLFFAFEVGFL
jgi:hypothetical protein